MEQNRIEKLDTAECWRLAQSAQLGRLAVGRLDGAPDVFPVNHLVHEGSVYLRTGPGSKLRAIMSAPEVAFEIDGEDADRHWSVVIHGTARRMTVAEEIEASGILRLASWTPTPKHIFVRITPTDITGRRFARSVPQPAVAADPPPASAAPPAAPAAPPASRPLAGERRRDKPKPIPHRPPSSPGRQP